MIINEKIILDSMLGYTKVVKTLLFANSRYCVSTGDSISFDTYLGIQTGRQCAIFIGDVTFNPHITSTVLHDIDCIMRFPLIKKKNGIEDNVASATKQFRWSNIAGRPFLDQTTMLNIWASSYTATPTGMVAGDVIMVHWSGNIFILE